MNNKKDVSSILKNSNATQSKMHQNISLYSNYVNNFESFQKKKQLAEGNSKQATIAAPASVSISSYNITPVSPGSHLRHATVQESIVEIPRSSSKYHFTQQQQQHQQAESDASSVSTEDFSQYSSPVQPVFANHQNSSINSSSSNNNNNNTSFTTPVNQSRTFHSQNQNFSSLSYGSNTSISALTPIIASDTLVAPLSTLSAASSSSWRERLEKYEESAQKHQQQLQQKELNIDKLLNYSVLGGKQSKKLNLFSHGSETPDKGSNTNADTFTTNATMTVSPSVLSSYFTTPAKTPQQETKQQQQTAAVPSNVNSVKDSISPSSNANVKNSNNKMKPNSPSMLNGNSANNFLKNDKSPEAVQLQMRTELNKKGIEIIEVQNEKLRMSTQFQQEREKWEQLKRSKDASLRQKQDELFAKEIQIKELKDEISKMKIKTENAVNDQQIYQEKCIELQELVESYVLHVILTHFCSLQKKVLEKDEESRNGDQGRVKQIIEEYNRVLDKEKISFQTFKNQKTQEILDLQTNLQEANGTIQALKKVEGEYAAVKEKYARVHAELLKLQQENKNSNQKQTQLISERNEELEVLKNEKADAIKRLEMVLQSHEEMQAQVTALKEKERELEQSNSVLMEEQITLRQNFTHKLKLKEDEFNEQLSSALASIQSSSPNASYAQSELLKVNRELNEVQSMIRNIIKLVRSTKLGNNDMSSILANEVSQNAKIIETQKKQTALQNVQAVRKELDYLKQLLTDLYAESLDSNCAPQ